MQAVEDTTYNGWKNYPTWAVNLWLSNDEPLYREALERTRHSVIASQTDIESGVWTKDEAARFWTADHLKSWVEDVLAPDLGASFSADLLGWALAHVDWHEIADAWIEQVEEQ